MGQQISTNDFKQGIKLEIDNVPYVIVTNEFVKPGKGQAFNRVRLKNLITGQVFERTFKSGDKCDLADIVETEMRFIYKEPGSAIFMDDSTFEQMSIPLSNIGTTEKWLKEDIMYSIMLYKGRPITVEPPTFLDLLITESSPAVRGDTSSGRVLKPAVVETGAEIKVPIFVNEGERVRVDTRTGEYTSRVND